jgi:HEPN domain-containing protein
MQTREEAEYRLSLAKSNLKDSGKFMRDGLFHWSVLSARLSVENSAKAIISCFRIPSWLHDPSAELRELIGELRRSISNRVGGETIEALRRLADAARELAPDRGKATYGIIDIRLTPTEIYGEAEAKRAVSLAEDSYETAEKFVKSWFL